MLELPQKFGKYTLVERIAVGGMAEIFKASAEGLGGFEKLLAIKRLHPRYSEDQDFIHMLVDEAKIASQLSHSNIGQIFDLGRENELIYIAMEYIDGRDLYQVLRRLAELGRPLPIEVAVYVVMEVCAGLDYAHRKTGHDGRPLSIIHRDISPQNIIASWEGEVKLIDFGIAKAAMRAFETESGVIKGKFYYMSPEQARGDSLDHRSDIFSLGLCLYELLTGATVYREEDDVTLLSRVRRADISPPTAMRPDLPIDLERIVMKTLRRDPNRRYQNANQLQMALSSFLHSLGQPFSKIQMGAYLRELFNREQVFEDIPMVYHDRFMSRVDYIDGETGLASELFTQDGVTAIVGERDTVRPGEIAAQDFYAEISLDDELGDFEAAPTRAGNPPEMAAVAPLSFDEDEQTWVYPGQLDSPQQRDRGQPAAPNIILPPDILNSPAASAPPHAAAMPLAAKPPPPPPVPGRRLAAPGGRQRRTGSLPQLISASPALAAPPPGTPSLEGARTFNFPGLEGVPDVHTGIVTGVYSEPTRITELDSVDGDSNALPAVIVRHDAELNEVPLGLKLLFAVGLAVIFLVGGTLSTLAAVFLQGHTASPQSISMGDLKGDGRGSQPVNNGPSLKPAADAQDAPDTRGLVVTVDGPAEAVVTLGDLPSQKAPAAFDKLVLGETYSLQVTADNFITQADRLIITEELPSGHEVKLQPRAGTVKLVTDPPGAVIQIDGRSTGKTTPANLGDIDRSKAHVVALTLEGHKTYEETVRWAGEDPDVKTVDVRLEAVKAEPLPVADADGQSDKASDGGKGGGGTPALAARQPRRNIESAPRAGGDSKPRETRAQRLARLRRERRERERQRRDAARDSAPAAPSSGGGAESEGFGTLSVNARPWGQVYVDGRRVANETPLTGLRVKSGYRKVKVVFPTLGGVTASRIVVISKGQNSPVFFTPPR